MMFFCHDFFFWILRLLLEDQRVFKRKKKFQSLKETNPSLAEEESMCDSFRYSDLWDCMNTPDGEDRVVSNSTRGKTSNLNSVDFLYEPQESSSKGKQENGTHGLPTSRPAGVGVSIAPPESLTQGVVFGNSDAIPKNMEVPKSMALPCSRRLFSRIVLTAEFVNSQGSQMEILIKTKDNNGNFLFLNSGDNLNEFYKHILQLIKGGKFSYNLRDDIPDLKSSQETKSNPRMTGNTALVAYGSDEEDSDDDDDDK